MPDALDVLSTVLELFGWAGVLLGLPTLLVGQALGRRGLRHHETVAVVVDPPRHARAATVRWFDHEGELHEAELDDHPLTTPVETEVVVRFSSSRPGRPRTDDPADDGKALRVTGTVLLVVGVACGVTSVVLLFVG